MRKSPLQNRVTPHGEIIATPHRGAWMGNRGGRLHDDSKQLTARRWASKHWICCLLSFRGRQRQIMAPNRYTELFFLDEATGFAAGHRPCAECRRSDFNRFIQLWAGIRGLDGRAYVRDIDDQLHLERLSGRKNKRTHETSVQGLPDGCFIRFENQPMLIRGDAVLTWTPGGYADPLSKRSLDQVEVLTPPSLVQILQAGYDIQIDASADL